MAPDPRNEESLKRREELLDRRAEYTMKKGNPMDKLYETEDMTLL